MVSVEDFIHTDVKTALKKNTIIEAANIMKDYNQGFLVVVNNAIENKPVGIITDNDIVLKVVANNLDPFKTLVGEVMTTRIISVSRKGDLVSDVACKMRDYKIRKIPVIENDQLYGVITNMDMVKVIIKHKKELLDMALSF